MSLYSIWLYCFSYWVSFIVYVLLFYCSTTVLYYPFNVIDIFINFTIENTQYDEQSSKLWRFYHLLFFIPLFLYFLENVCNIFVNNMVTNLLFAFESYIKNSQCSIKITLCFFLSVLSGSWFVTIVFFELIFGRHYYLRLVWYKDSQECLETEI